MSERSLQPFAALLVVALGGSCADEESSWDTAARRPVCSGCLCLDPTWSCDADTWLAADGGVVELKPEAGFFEIEERCFTYKGEDRCIEPARMWYAFQPADEAPGQRPLVVFFNGSWGDAESGMLFAHNTARNTLDPKLTGGSGHTANPHSWTAFANVLYPEPRHAGFSYALGESAPAEELPSNRHTVHQEMADVIRLLVRFLERHPQIRANPVIFVGESAAGIRVTALVEMLLNYGQLSEPDSAYADHSLRQELQGHFDATTASPGGGLLTIDQVAQQFGHQVFIQPLLLGELQIEVAMEMADAEPWPDCTGLESLCEQTRFAERDDACMTAVVNGLLTPEVLSSMTLVDIATVEWLHAESRERAVRFESVPECTDGEGGPGVDDWNYEPMIGSLGELDADDSYYLLHAFGDPQEDMGEVLSPVGAYRFLRNATIVRTFITNAVLDSIVYGPSIAEAIRRTDDAVSSVTHDTAPRDGVARPGWMTIEYRDDWVGSSDTVREIRMPIYPESGHMVPAWQPAEILEDVRTWYEDGR